MNSPAFAIIRNGQVELLNPLSLPEGTKLLVTPISSEIEIDDDDNWSNLSLEGLNLAYHDDEPEYSLEQIKEWNPDYEGG